ncbi:MAG: hypothetical protein IJ599_02130 [Alphaproteobacteria bacterium]|nr:hypothetical protein [Alphaproteobacteria bacterium]MBR1479674.1 hypothetical protein [Alphaproteobacteria bacterium]
MVFVNVKESVGEGAASLRTLLSEMMGAGCLCESRDHIVFVVLAIMSLSSFVIRR